MNRTIPIIVFLMVFASSSVAAETTGRMHDAPADTFLTNCELILFGREVPRTALANGKVGYRLAKSDYEVTVNGVVVVSLSTPYLPPQRPVTESVEKMTTIFRTAAENIWRSRELNKGSVVVANVAYRDGDSFAMMLPELDASVMVTLRDKSMVLEYSDIRAFYPLKRPTSVSQDNVESRRLDAAYRGMIDDLRPGKLIVKGGGYAYVFPLSEGSAIRAALREIPARAEVELVDPYEGTYYKPLTISGVLWTSGVISDVMRQRE